VQLLISPLIVWLITRCHKRTAQYKRGWFWLVFLCLSTHGILDSFTVYGTQLLWPVTEHPFAVANLFIIDPLYTLPLLFAFVGVLLPGTAPGNARTMIRAALATSSLYLCWSLAAQVYIDYQVKIALNDRQIKVDNYLSTPAPLSTLLWRILVMSDGRYYEGYLSVFDSPSELTLVAYHSSDTLLATIEDEWGVQRLQWFTKGFYSIEKNGKDIVLSDLRMGAECSYVFNFIVGEQTNTGIVAGDFEKYSEPPDLSQLGNIWDRIWDSSVSLAANKRSGGGVSSEPVG
jgi:inner membrane protein